MMQNNVVNMRNDKALADRKSDNNTKNNNNKNKNNVRSAGRPASGLNTIEIPLYNNNEHGQ